MYGIAVSIVPTWCRNKGAPGTLVWLHDSEPENPHGAYIAVVCTTVVQSVMTESSLREGE